MIFNKVERRIALGLLFVISLELNDFRHVLQGPGGVLSPRTEQGPAVVCLVGVLGVESDGGVVLSERGLPSPA